VTSKSAATGQNWDTWSVESYRGCGLKPGPARLLMDVSIRAVDNGGTASPGLDVQAADTRLTRRTVQQRLAELLAGRVR
jgi:hypothetical protein